MKYYGLEFTDDKKTSFVFKVINVVGDANGSSRFDKAQINAFLFELFGAKHIYNDFFSFEYMSLHYDIYINMPNGWGSRGKGIKDTKITIKLVTELDRYSDTKPPFFRIDTKKAIDVKTVVRKMENLSARSKTYIDKALLNKRKLDDDRRAKRKMMDRSRELSFDSVTVSILDNEIVITEVDAEGLSSDPEFRNLIEKYYK